MRISVVIAAYNAARTLGETLASVHAQTRPPDEVVVVDDGSTDDTAAIAAADPRVRLLSQANGGCPQATNAGLRASTGDAFALIDADDLWTPEKLELQERALESEPGIDGVFGEVDEFLCPTLTEAERARFGVRERQPGWMGGAMLARRRLFETVGPFNESLRVGQFIDWIDRAQHAGARWQMRPELVLRRRLHPGSLTQRSAARDRDMIAMARLALQRRRT